MAPRLSVAIASILLALCTSRTYGELLTFSLPVSVRTTQGVKWFNATYKGMVKTPGYIAAVKVMVNGYQKSGGYVHANIGAIMEGITKYGGFVGSTVTTFKGTFMYYRDAKLSGVVKTDFDGVYSGMPLKMKTNSEMKLTLYKNNKIRLTEKGEFNSVDWVKDTVKVHGSYQIYMNGDKTTYYIQGKLQGKNFKYKITETMEDMSSWMENGLFGEYHGLYDGKPWNGKWPMPKKAVTGPK